LNFASNKHQSVSFQNELTAFKLENTTFPIIVNVEWMVNKENTRSFLNQLPYEVDEEERLANAWSTSDDCFVDAK
jgi:hypothetical protein